MISSTRRFRIEGGSNRPSSSFISNNNISIEDIDFINTNKSYDTGSKATVELEELRNMLEPIHELINDLSRNKIIHNNYNLEDDADNYDKIDKNIVTTTKKSLAAIIIGPKLGSLDLLSKELILVATQTEYATQDILRIVENIEGIAGAIQSETKLENAKSLANTIAEKVIEVYMACNFQDLCGQRITRAVDSICFIEREIDNIFEAWGGDEDLKSFIEYEKNKKNEEQETEGIFALNNGPDIVESNDRIDQSSIDALFD